MADVADPVPAAEVSETAAAEHNYVFNVSMSCGGCSGAVERVLKKLEGMPVPLPFQVREAK